MTNCKYLDDYIKQVKSGQYRVCKEQIQLVNFIEKVFENEQVYVDSEQVEKYFALQKYFPYELFAWEKFCFILHNCTYSAPGVLRFPDLVCVVGRGAGKNGYLAFEDFSLLTPVNGIRNYDIDICATSEEQASTTFNDIYEILENNSTKMQRHFKWNKTEITNIKTNSTIRYRTSNSKTKDGGRPGKVDFDEKHAYENYKLIDVFTTGLGKKAMPRRTTITTMGDVRDGPLDNELAAGLEVLNGDAPDNGTLYFICRLDNEKEVYEQENWYKANPSLQYFPNLLREIQKEFEDWKRDKVNNSSFMTKRMNIPKGTEMHPVTAWENIKATNRPLPDLEGKTCVFGLDYTKTTDFLGAGLLFMIDNEIVWKPMSWYCSQSADLSRIKFPYDKQPDLQRVDGAEISPQIVAEWLKEQKKHYNIIAGALDNYRYTLLKSPLLECGFECDRKGLNNLKLVRPSDKMLVAPLIASDFANHKIVWGDSALMRWYTNNTSATEDKNGNISYGKIEPKSRKTDGFMAFVAAYTQLDLLRQSQPISTDNFKKFFKAISI
ncbi:terminase large subunit [Ruminococcus sp. FMB-CY1]|uniref:terminase large subunit domain-containing protein n=1 Tax=unclassified Ruminococcus TaxID=2608920 RepID=UPI00208E5B32|nr:MULTISPECIES: terminase large subunit [unclassified Ruminococcus]USP68878.1 terminase large subunit [Ruminococcus sp. FMBCY1]WBX57819.1 terminase large subunit [Ruminococcus sp. FMB-CY1]